MDIVGKIRDGAPPQAVQVVEPNSLCGRLLDLCQHLEREGHISPLDKQLVLTLVHHPEMHPHLKSDASRPIYPLSADYAGPVEEYKA